MTIAKRVALSSLCLKLISVPSQFIFMNEAFDPLRDLINDGSNACKEVRMYAESDVGFTFRRLTLHSFAESEWVEPRPTDE